MIFNHFFIKIRRGRRILYVFVLVQNEFPPPRTENEFLISELRPPLLNTDFFEYLMAKLGGLPAESQADYWLKPLEKIRKKIIEYNSLHPGEGIKKYHEIIDLMKKIYVLTGGAKHDYQKS